MFLTRLYINPMSQHAATLLREPYRLHQFVKEKICFDQPVLFRLEEGQQQVFMLIQSPGKPDLSWLGGEGAYLLARPAEIKEYKPAFRDGQRLVFRLTANPTVKEKETEKRVALEEVDELLEWLEIKAERSGFRVEHAQVSFTDKVWVNRKGNKFSIGRAQFDGVLTVTDAATFAQAYAEGIGRSKYLGCGLLLLAPAQ